MSDPKKPAPSGAELLSLGGLLAAAVVVPIVAGLWIDSSAHSSPLGVVCGLGIGIVVASLVVYLRFKRYW